jgi:hypothetical protein
MVNYIKNHNLKEAKKKYKPFIKEQQLCISGESSKTVAEIIAAQCAK